MRTVLIGADFMYDSTGNLKTIEINTNANISSNSLEIENVFDLSNLGIFIQNNSFTKVTYIGRINSFQIKLKQYCQNNNLTYDFAFEVEASLKDNIFINDKY